MTLTFAIVGFCFVFENQNLLILALSLNFARYFGTFNNRFANFDIAICNNSQDFVKYYSFTFSSSQFLVAKTNQYTVIRLKTLCCTPCMIATTDAISASSSVKMRSTISKTGSARPTGRR